MRTTTKIWSCVGVFTALTAGCTDKGPEAASEGTQAGAAQVEGAGAASSGAPADVFNGDFSGALAKVLEGEGGEGGLGTYFSEGKMVIPRLNESQIKEALSENSLRRSSHFAVHFAQDGTMSGWERIAETVEPALCAAGKDPAYKLDDGVCQHRKQVPVDGTTWKVQGDQVCTQPALRRIAEGQECFAVFLVLNEVALVAPGDKMIGKGSRLSQGKVLDPIS